VVAEIKVKPVARRRASAGTDEAKPGKREENKQRKLAKIAKAAKQVFSKKGFDVATMQEIAKLAGVATGTLFLYADNKRDIAYLAMADDFNQAVVVASTLPTNEAYVDQIVACWRPYFVMHNANPEMAKIILSEFLFFAGKQARRHGEGVVAMKSEATRRAVLCQQRGELTGTVLAAEIADLAYYLFQGVVRRWVQGGAIDVSEGLAMFHRALSLGLAGLMVKPAA
jgi:AcrR family transcriptional regulator